MTIICCDCKESLEKAAFAKAQLKKAASDRRCRQCASKREEESSSYSSPAGDPSPPATDSRSSSSISKPRCAFMGCTVQTPATLFCSRCKTVGYCSEECQLKHWPRHRLVCKHVAKHRGEKGRKKELRQQIKPWTRRTTYEEKDRDFELFEKTFEKYIAQVAAEHKNDDELGLVLVDISVMSHPLNLRWCRFKDMNKHGEPKLSRATQRELLDGFDRERMYIAMSVYGGPSGIQYERDSTWLQAPIQVFSYAGRGSNYYQGPTGFEATLQSMEQVGVQISPEVVQRMLQAGAAGYPTNEEQRREAQERLARG